MKIARLAAFPARLREANTQSSLFRLERTVQYFWLPMTRLGLPVAVAWLSDPEGVVALLLALMLPGDGAVRAVGAF